MTSTTEVKSVLNKDQIRIPYEDLDKNLSHFKAEALLFGGFALPAAISMAFNPSHPLLSALGVAGAATWAVFGSQSYRKIKNRISEIIGFAGTRGEEFKNIITSQLNRVFFTHALAGAVLPLTGITVASAVIKSVEKIFFSPLASHAVASANNATPSAGFLWAAAATAVTISGLLNYNALRSDRDMRISLSHLPKR